MIASGEGFDLTVLELPEVQLDPEWQEWAGTFKQVLQDVRTEGLGYEEAEERALAAANASVKRDPEEDLQFVTFVK